MTGIPLDRVKEWTNVRHVSAHPRGARPDGRAIIGGDGSQPQAQGPLRRGAQRRRAARRGARLHELLGVQRGAHAEPADDRRPGRARSTSSPARSSPATRARGRPRTSGCATAPAAARCPSPTTGALPDPFREGREVIVERPPAGRRLRRRARLADHEVPLEVHGRAEQDLIMGRRADRGQGLPDPGARDRACTASARRCTGRAAAGASGSPPAAAPSTPSRAPSRWRSRSCRRRSCARTSRSRSSRRTPRRRRPPSTARRPCGPPRRARCCSGCCSSASGRA